MSGDLATVVDLTRQGLAVLVFGAGLVFVLLGVIGLLRFPDLFTRVHAFSTIAGLGAGLTLFGFAILAWDVQASVRLALLALVIAGAGPVIAHVTAGAAHAAGLAPLSGNYTAPRPGVERRRTQP